MVNYSIGLGTGSDPGRQLYHVLNTGIGLPEPAVSVPRAKLTMPPPTAAPDPDEDPPGINLRMHKAW